MKKKRMILGVVTAEADNIEQRQILVGIIEQAQELNIDIAVFSNIYNPNVPDTEVSCENKIYKLILSQELDALILISESIVNTELQQLIKRYILQRNNIPVIIVGVYLPEFDAPNFRFINTSDENDIMDITNHLISSHGFTDIDILTGYPFLEASNLRVKGYKRALESHGIQYNDDKVFFGNFWTDSGQELAKQYIRGEIPLPEAIICANDYMAYGLLDEFSENHIRIPEDVTVVGYEYIHKRLYHAPLLTTYQRNRKALGTEAVKILYSKITNGVDITFSPPKGELIQGNSCTCGIKNEQFNQELRAARTKEFYDHLNLYSQMEHRLTECSSLNDFIRICGEYHYLVRDAHDIYLCLSDNWHDSSPDDKSDIMSYRSIMPWLTEKPSVNFNQYQLSEIFGSNQEAAVYYFNPLFFSNRMFGYIVLKYDTPDTYDLIYRNWIKTISNALEFLRMKNDIKYLSKCQNLSESRDSLTGLYSEKGFEKELKFAIENAKPEQNLIMLIARTNFAVKDIDLNNKNIMDRVNIAIEAAECVKCLVQHENEFCGRLSDNVFLFAGVGSYPPDYDKILLDKLKTLICHAKLHQEKYGAHAFVCASMNRSVSEGDLNSNIRTLRLNLNRQADALTAKQVLPNYDHYAKLRNEVYSNPQKLYSTTEVCQRFELSYGHFRATYKAYFGISYHQDCIIARISLAKYLLLSTTMNVSSIAYRCGYEDEKYFMRQFRQITTYTPNQYRSFHS